MKERVYFNVCLASTLGLLSCNAVEKPRHSNSTVFTEAASNTIESAPSKGTTNHSQKPTEDPLNVQDNSHMIYAEVQLLVANGTYSDVINDLPPPTTQSEGIVMGQLSSSAGIESDDAPAIIDTKRDGSRFLYTGKKDSRTSGNCYLLKAKDSLSMHQLMKIGDILRAMNGDIRHQYDSLGMKGYSVCFPNQSLPLKLLKSIKGIEWVERDQVVKIQQVQEDAPWQLSRVSNPDSKKYMGPYQFSATGKGVNVYVVDSGADVGHPEFQDRAKLVFSAFGKNFPQDCAGHGTQVASVIGGLNVGVAKQANLFLVQVLGCDGQGENSSILAGISWVVANHKKPAVINMSVGGPQSHMIDSAVQAAIDKGIPVVAAAGNSHVDACIWSPSGVKAAMVVGSTTFDNERAPFSNYGSCVDIFAPGKQVLTAATPESASKNGFTFVSGTSMSAPIVAGIYALILESKPSASPLQLQNIVIGAAREGLIDEESLMGSPNLFAQVPEGLPGNGDDLTFLAASAYPKFGTAVGGMDTVEFILVIVGGGFALAFLILAIIAIWKRFARKRKERAELKKAIAAASSTTHMIPETDD